MREDVLCAVSSKWSGCVGGVQRRGASSEGTYSVCTDGHAYLVALYRSFDMAPLLTRVPVVIVGGGPVGLTLSSLLSKYGVRSMLVERAPQTPTHPKAHFINTRTMEIFRLLGVHNKVYEAMAPVEHWRRFRYCTSLLGPNNELGQTDHFSPNLPAAFLKMDRNSPCRVANLPQSRLTQILWDHASEMAKMNENFASSLHFGTEVKSITESEDTIQVNVRTVGAQRGVEATAVECDVLVGADGASSLVRHEMGILMKGQPELQFLMNVHFFSPSLWPRLKDRAGMLYFVFNPSAVVVLIAHDLERGEWVAQIPYFPPQQSPDDFDEGACRRILNAAIGGSGEEDIQIRSIHPWTMGAEIAERFQSASGRVSLVGDAAHQFPPSGGFGMNTGIQDAHNLAWKIAKTMQNSSGMGWDADLLRTYEAERKPIAEANSALSMYNFDSAMRIPSALGLSPKAANAVSKLLAKSPASILPRRMQRGLLESVMSVGLQQINVFGPNANNPASRFCMDRVQAILKEGRGLHLLFPAYELGFTYAHANSRGALGTDDAPDATPQPAALVPGESHEYEPSTAPGARFPHFPVRVDGTEVRVLSSLDFVGEDTRCALWFDAASAPLDWAEIDAEERLGWRLVPFTFAPHEETETTLGTSVYISDAAEDGGTSFDTSSLSGLAVLVRPDGHVGWRGRLGGNFEESQMWKSLANM